MKEESERSGLVPFDFSGIINEVPELSRFACKIDSYTFDPLIDSSDVEPGLWQKLAILIKEKYDLLESYDMTIESLVSKIMWIRGMTNDKEEIKELLYTPIYSDILR